MKIISIRPQLISSDYGDNQSFGQPLGVKSLGLVVVKLDNGVTGIGESYSSIYLPELFAHTINSISPFLINIDFDDPRDIFSNFFIPFCSRSGFIQSSYSAIDIAIWDAFLKSINLSLYAYLEKQSLDPLFYFSGGTAVSSPDEIRAEIDTINPHFDGFKMRICRQSWDSDIERISAAKESWNKPLMVDSIMGTLRPAFDLRAWNSGKLADLNSLDIYWLEEPLAPDNLFDLSCLLASDCRPRIALGESIVGKFELNTMLDYNLDILQLDVTQCGGISLLLSLLPLIDRFSEVAFHVWGSPASFAANLQFSYLIKAKTWVEYPGVALHLFKDCCPQFFSEPGQLLFFKDLSGFSTSKMLDTINSSQFIPNSGYRVPT